MNREQRKAWNRSRIENHIGKKFGSLTILSFSYVYGRKHGYPAPKALCLCDCGNKKKIWLTSLKYKETKSCGCLKGQFCKDWKRKDREKKGIAFGDFAINIFLRKYKDSAKERGLIFNLPRERFAELIKQNCYYCGESPKEKRGTRKGSEDYVIGNGIDRLDSSLGYEPFNMVACCTFCNYAKRDYSEKEFLEKINKIYLHRFFHE